MSNPTSPAPGWYPDPANSVHHRWWDGLQWTHHTQLVAPRLEAAEHPAQSQTECEFSGWWRRCAAVLIDGLIVGVFARALLGLLDPQRIQNFGQAGLFSGPALMYDAIVAAAWVLFCLRWLTRRGDRNGQTLGKQLMHIKVVRVDGAPVDPKTVLMGEFLFRQLLYLTVVYAFVDYLWPLGDRENCALHDRGAATRVVKVPR